MRGSLPGVFPPRGLTPALEALVLVVEPATRVVPLAGVAALRPDVEPEAAPALRVGLAGVLRLTVEPEAAAVPRPAGVPEPVAVPRPLRVTVEPRLGVWREAAGAEVAGEALERAGAVAAVERLGEGEEVVRAVEPEGAAVPRVTLEPLARPLPPRD